MQFIHRHSTRCLVCGFHEVRTDEAVDHGLVFLAECPRCEHRWTSSTPPSGSGAAFAPVPVRAGVRAAREVAPAA